MSETVSKDFFTKVLVGGAIGFCVLLFVASGIFAYVGARSFSESSVVLTLTRVFGVPVAKVNGERILYADYVADKKIIEMYNEQQGGQLDAAGISDVVLQRLIANTLLVQEARSFGVAVSDKELDDELNTLFEQAPSREEAERSFVEQFSQFGWDMDDYKQNVLYYAVLQKKLTEAVATLPEGETGIEEVQARHILLLTTPEKATSTVQAAAQAALDRIKAGEDFATVAMEVSEDQGSAINGGELGWFARGVMVPEFEEAAFALEPGAVTESLVQTQYGFHIIKSEGKRQARDVEAYFSEVFDGAQIEMTLDIANPFEQTVPTQPEVEGVSEGADELNVEVQ
jgi:foldase protein PrsA